MASKRPAVDDSALPPAKKPLLIPSSLPVLPATSQEDLDVKILQIQNRKLSERLRERNHHEELIQLRVDRLEEEKEGAVEVIVLVDHHLRSLLQELKAHLGLCTEETILSSLTNLSHQSASAAKSSLDQFFSSLLSSVKTRGSQLFSQLKELKDDVSTSQNVGESTIRQLEKIVTERQQSIDALEELREQMDPSEVQKYKSRVEVLESKCERLENDLADARFDLEKSLTRSERLERQLSEAMETRSTFSPSDHSVVDGGEKSVGETAGFSVSSMTTTPLTIGGNGDPSRVSSLSNEEVDILKGEVEEAQKLAESRLQESGQLSKKITELKQELEKQLILNQQVSESIIQDSGTYKSVQSQFSVLLIEHQQLRSLYEEAKRLLTTAKNQYIMQLEEIRQEELKYQSEVRDEMSQLENTLANVKREYELLKIDHEQMMASNEQAAPKAKELQHAVSSLQKNIQMLKSEVSRYKTRAHKAEEKLNKEEKEKKVENKPVELASFTDNTCSTPIITHTPVKGRDIALGRQRSLSASDMSDMTPSDSSQTSLKLNKELTALKEQLIKLEAEKKKLEAQVMDYSTASKEIKEKAELISAEKKARQYADDLRKRLEESRKEYEKKKEHLKEDNKQLQKEVSNKKQEALALMGEMESIAQAFEEVQEQNLRLLEQLKEKDDANFKLMSERIKSNSIQKILNEEKQLLVCEVEAITAEKEKMNNLVQKLEDRDKNSEAAVNACEKELNLKQQMFELHKKKALEASQQLQDMTLRVGELEKVVTATQKSMMNKTDECEKEAAETRRVQEELIAMKRKLEKYKQKEWSAMSDEVLVEEIKTYRNKLNCPVCSSRKKDTVLTKCFHVFCADCIKTRYETRQRKCPKCNAAFGANDFHKIYLS